MEDGHLFILSVMMVLGILNINGTIGKIRSVIFKYLVKRRRAKDVDQIVKQARSRQK